MTGGRFLMAVFGDTELADAFDCDPEPTQHGAGRYLTDMADVLRAAGLEVTEQEGWTTRARSSGGYADGRPSCIMWHHAASAPGSSAENVANYASYGSDVAPVCNLVLGRDGGVIVGVRVPAVERHFHAADADFDQANRGASHLGFRIAKRMLDQAPPNRYPNMGSVPPRLLAFAFLDPADLLL